MISMRPRSRRATALAGLGLALALSGCSSSDTTDSATAWCTGADAVESELAKMSTLIEEGASSDLVRTQWNAVESAIQANSVPLSQLEDATQQEISAAYDALGAAVEAIPSDASPAEAAPQYKAAIDTFNTDMQSIEAEVCS
jgi:hypothetical protein